VITPWFWPYTLITKCKKLYIPYHEYVSSALCYVINRQGAKKLLQTNKPIMRSEIYIYTNVKTYTYKYPMFTYPTKNNSTIHKDHLPDHVYSKN